jgi:hypothetical protein
MDLNDEYLQKIKQLNDIMDLLKTSVEVEAVCKHQVQKILSDLKNISLEADKGTHELNINTAFRIVLDKEGTA